MLTSRMSGRLEVNRQSVWSWLWETEQTEYLGS